jgi:hypothetical protein
MNAFDLIMHVANISHTIPDFIHVKKKKKYQTLFGALIYFIHVFITKSLHFLTGKAQKDLGKSPKYICAITQKRMVNLELPYNLL